VVVKHNSRLIIASYEHDTQRVIGRKPMWGEPEPVWSPFHGKHVVVTGACGGIGKHVILAAKKGGALMGSHGVDINENAMAAFEAWHTELGPVFQHCDVRSPSFVEHIQPASVVVHCAAMKHVRFCESSPLDAFAVNVLGTMNVMQAVHDVGGSMVFVSTDKATRPTGVMGATKRIAEAVVRSMGGSVVRLANVMHSPGSVFDLWPIQLGNGLVPTITNPDATRYYMTHSEVSYTIEQALDFACKRSVTLVYNAGDPISTGELYKRLMKADTLPETSTGLREGEKLHEQLFDPAEGPVSRAHTTGGTDLVWELTTLDDQRCLEALPQLTTMYRDRARSDEFRSALMGVFDVVGTK
jgi:FlaA1/EpsC-like NDP-sugar epimerase